jgi:hypothetical protein
MQNFAVAGFSVPQLVQVCDAMQSRYGMPKPCRRVFHACETPCVTNFSLAAWSRNPGGAS